MGNSLQKYAYLPENATDSIFAIIAEELGFVGAVFIIGVFLVIIWRGFYIAINSKDAFGKLLAGGITTFLAMQIIVNLAAQTALLPLTGIPLPFISYGGSGFDYQSHSNWDIIKYSKARRKNMKIVIIGGHLSPALAVIEKLKTERIFYFGRKHTFEGDKAISLEYQEIAKLGIPFYCH